MRNWQSILAAICVAAFLGQPLEQARPEASEQASSEVKPAATVDSGPATLTPFGLRETARKSFDDSQQFKICGLSAVAGNRCSWRRPAPSDWTLLSLSPTLQHQAVRWQI
jgi:hypothetical protein